MMKTSASKRVLAIHRMTALIVFNSILLFIVLNLFAYIGIAIFKLTDRFGGRSNPIAIEYGTETVKRVYPELSLSQANALLKETWSRPLVFEAYTHFKERPYKGDYVNVDANGFRVTKNQGPWPPNTKAINIFLFGGSTVFGYGVADGDTVASYLQEYLSEKLKRDIRVYNFGRGYYFSTQERILFEHLLTQGHKPYLALFIDGVNEDKYGVPNEPYYTTKLREYVEHGRKEPMWGRIFTRMPVLRLTRILEERVSRHRSPFAVDPPVPASTGERLPMNRNIEDGRIFSALQTYLQNKQLIETISQSYGVKTAFVWQPSPVYKCGAEGYAFLSKEEGKRIFLRYLYEYLNEYRFSHNMEDNFFWCADIQEGLRGPLYVDKIHYSSHLCQTLSQTIGDRLIRKGYFPN